MLERARMEAAKRSSLASSITETKDSSCAVAEATRLSPARGVVPVLTPVASG